MYGEMTERLEQAFEYSAIWYFEKVDDKVEELTEEDGRNIDTFRALEKIRQGYLAGSDAGCERACGKISGVCSSAHLHRASQQRMYGQFRHPATAAGFVEQLNTFIRRETVALVPG